MPVGETNGLPSNDESCFNMLETPGFRGHTSEVVFVLPYPRLLKWFNRLAAVVPRPGTTDHKFMTIFFLPMPSKALADPFINSLTGFYGVMTRDPTNKSAKEIHCHTLKASKPLTMTNFRFHHSEIWSLSPLHLSTTMAPLPSVALEDPTPKAPGFHLHQPAAAHMTLNELDAPKAGVEQKTHRVTSNQWLKYDKLIGNPYG